MLLIVIIILLLNSPGITPILPVLRFVDLTLVVSAPLVTLLLGSRRYLVLTAGSGEPHRPKLIYDLPPPPPVPPIPIPSPVHVPASNSALAYLIAAYIVAVAIGLHIITQMNKTGTSSASSRRVNTPVGSSLSDNGSTPAFDVFQEELANGSVSAPRSNSGAVGGCVGTREASYSHALILHPTLRSTNIDVVVPAISAFTRALPEYVREIESICSRLDRFARLMQKGVSPTCGDFVKQIDIIVSRASELFTIVMEEDDNDTEDTILIKDRLSSTLLEAQDAAEKLISGCAPIIELPAFRSKPLVPARSAPSYGRLLSVYMGQVEELTSELNDIAPSFREGRLHRGMKKRTIRLWARMHYLGVRISNEHDNEVILLKDFMCSILDQAKKMAHEAHSTIIGDEYAPQSIYHNCYYRARWELFHPVHPLSDQSPSIIKDAPRTVLLEPAEMPEIDEASYAEGPSA